MKTLRVTVDSACSFAESEAPPGLVEQLEAALSIANPKHAAAKRMGRTPWGTPAKLCFLQREADGVRIPRGAPRVLRELAQAEGVKLLVADRRVLPVERLDAFPDVPLRAYQRKAIEELLRWHQGVFVFPCGAGKTRTAIGVIARLGVPTLILVAALDLAAQWRDELRTLLGVIAGLVGGGEARVAPVTIATVQTLQRWPTEALDAFLRQFGLLIIDEAHHTPSSTFAGIVDRCPAKYRLALTATPEREDGLGPVLEWFVGPVIATVKHAELIESGALIAPAIRVLETSFEFQYSGPDDYHELLEALVQDEARNRLIIDAVVADAKAGHTILVLTGRVEHCNHLALSITARGVKAASLTGTMPKSRRADVLQSARDGKTSVVVATSLADEGLDLPRLSRVVLAFPAKAAGRTEQRLGRIMRPHADKRDAALIDVVDVRVGVLKHQHKQRLATFKAVLGLEQGGGVP